MATTTPSTAASANGASFNFTGAISGLDTAGIIQAMLAVEKAPLTTITTKRTDLQAQQSAYEQLRTLLGTFQTKLQQFTVWNQGAARTAASSNAAVLSATSGTGTAAGTYQVSVSRLATSTVARSTAPMATQLDDASAGAKTLSSLPLAGAITGGVMSVVVDASIVQVTIDPSATLSKTLSDIAAAIQGKTGGTVAGSADGNRVSFSISGAAGDHRVSFGAGGDSSNAAALFGLSGVASTTFGTTSTSLASTTALGVVRTSTTLDTAGLAGLAATSKGTLKVNGASIAYDTSKDTLTDIVSRINTSGAGVVASLDRGSDALVLSAKTGGAAPIAITDTGALAAALQLNPGTTTGQTLGVQAQLSVDGRTIYSDTNTVSTAIDGVKLNLLSLGNSTVSISPDTTATTTAAQGIVDAYNALADALDGMTANGVNQTKGALAGVPTVRDMALSLRSAMTGIFASGSLSSLADVGISTGAVGSKIGTTSRLQLDATRLSDAIAKDPTSVASLFKNVATPLVAQVKAWTSYGGNIDSAEKDITTSLNDLTDQEAAVNERVATRQAALEAKFAQMESLLAQMQTTTASLNNSIAQQNKSSG